MAHYFEPGATPRWPVGRCLAASIGGPRRQTLKLWHKLALAWRFRLLLTLRKTESVFRERADQRDWMSVVRVKLKLLLRKRRHKQRIQAKLGRIGQRTCTSKAYRLEVVPHPLGRVPYCLRAVAEPLVLFRPEVGIVLHLPSVSRVSVILLGNIPSQQRRKRQQHKDKRGRQHVDIRRPYLGFTVGARRAVATTSGHGPGLYPRAAGAPRTHRDGEVTAALDAETPKAPPAPPPPTTRLSPAAPPPPPPATPDLSAHTADTTKPNPAAPSAC